MILEEFKNACLKEEANVIVQQYLIEGNSFYFQEKDDINEEFKFKKELAESLSVHIRDIAIVGSAKLGFSIKPDRNNSGMYLFKKFDCDYLRNDESEKSDIDIAIISSSLFDEQLLKLYKYTDSYRDLSGFYNKSYVDHSKYIVRGWLRPDKIPKDYNITDNITDFQKKI